MPVSSLRQRWSLVFASLLIACPIAAREVWVVRFRTFLPDVPPCQALVGWHSHLMFTNTTQEEQTVRVLAATNGSGLRPDARQLQIPPSRTVSVRGTDPPDLHWEPAGRLDTEPLLWINKLDVPMGVLIAARGESHVGEPRPTDPPCPTRQYFSAGVPLPAVPDLVPAGAPQYHVGVDIGDQINSGLHTDARFNVGIFNAGDRPAVVQVQVRCSAATADLQNGPDPTLATVFLTVAPNALTQQSVVTSTQSLPCTLGGGANPYHIVITSDQPGFSYALGLDNEQLPRFPANIAVTH
jgi:hypothetical protein